MNGPLQLSLLGLALVVSAFGFVIEDAIRHQPVTRRDDLIYFGAWVAGLGLLIAAVGWAAS